MVLALDLVERIAEGVEEILVGVENDAVQREFDDRLRLVDGVQHAAELPLRTGVCRRPKCEHVSISIIRLIKSRRCPAAPARCHGRLVDRLRKKIGKIDECDHPVVIGDKAGEERSFCDCAIRGTGLISAVSRETMSSTRSPRRPTGLAVDLHDDHDVKRRRFRLALTEAAAQIDDRDNHAAQVEHAAHIFRLSG